MAKNKSASLDFGTVIAFVAPGFVAFKSLTYYSPTARNWMNAAASNQQTFGVFLFVLLASIALGIGVSGLRALLFDNLFHCRCLRGWRIERPRVAWRGITDDQRQALSMLIEGFYRYYQFYSNSLVALLALLFARVTGYPEARWSLGAVAALAFASLTLLWSAHDSYSKYSSGVANLFGWQ